MNSAGEARLERFRERGAVEVLADEDERVGARVPAPFAIEFRVEEHVDISVADVYVLVCVLSDVF